MTNEEKQLLLKDLCSRLPYGVKVHIEKKHIDEYPYTCTCINDYEKLSVCGFSVNLLTHIEKYGVKPYLRPMSSMTEEEFLTLYDMCSYKDFQFRAHHTYYTHFKIKKYVPDFIYDPNQLDYLISHHFDYCGLFEKGLALEAPEGMYNF